MATGNPHKEMRRDYPKIYLYRQIVQAKLFVDDNYADSLELDNIADEAYFSKFHFIRLFKKIYGRTPHQYLTWIRIENAKLLLKKGIAVSDVCYSVGFESLSSFSGLFRRVVGVSPSVYLENERIMKEEIRKSPLKFVPGCFA